MYDAFAVKPAARAKSDLAFALMTVLAALTPTATWSQPAPAVIEKAYVAIFPEASSDPDFVLALQHGIEVVLCQAGIKQHEGAQTEGAQTHSELKLTASLTNADYWTDRQAREIVRQCTLTKATATLPGGANVELPDLAISGRAVPARGATDGRKTVESFFVACGASFARTALDALKDKVAVRGSTCDEQPSPPPRRKPYSTRRTISRP